MSATPGQKTVEGAAPRGLLTRVAVVMAVLLGMLGLAAGPAMAATATPVPQKIVNVQALEAPVTVGGFSDFRVDDHGMAGETVYFTKKETNLISSGAWFTVGWKLGGYVGGLAAAMGAQYATDAVADGKCLRMRTLGVFSFTPIFTAYDCSE